MDKEKVYNEAVGGDEGFAAGDGYPSCDGEPCLSLIHISEPTRH